MPADYLSLKRRGEIMNNLSNSRSNTILIVALFALMWGAFFLNEVTSRAGLNLNAFGITPRSLFGLTGIFLSPLLHSSFAHIVGNSTSLLTFLALLIATQQRIWLAIPALWVSSGSLLWLFGTSHTTVIGASGLIYACAAYLIVVGFAQRDFLTAALGLFCGFLYGASLLSGIVGTGGTNVSWQAHLFGAVAGTLIALASESFRRFESQTETAARQSTSAGSTAESEK